MLLRPSRLPDTAFDNLDYLKRGHLAAFFVCLVFSGIQTKIAQMPGNKKPDQWPGFQVCAVTAQMSFCFQAALFSVPRLRRRGGMSSARCRTGCGGALPAGCKRWRCVHRNRRHQPQQGSSKETCSFPRRLRPTCSNPNAGGSCYPSYIPLPQRRIAKTLEHPLGGKDPNSFR